MMGSGQLVAILFVDLLLQACKAHFASWLIINCLNAECDCNQQAAHQHLEPSYSLIIHAKHSFQQRCTS